MLPDRNNDGDNEQLSKVEPPLATGKAPSLREFDYKTDVKEYGKEEYWRSRYSKDTSAFEWFVSLGDVRASNAVIDQVLKSRIASKARVLEIGCGTSTLSAELWDMGFRDITACDYQESVIKVQKERQLGTSRKVCYEVQDMRDLRYQDGVYDLVIEKGAIDALVCSSLDDAKKGASELYRVLRPKVGFVVVGVMGGWVRGWVLI